MKVGRNDPCPCGSGRKYKQCCLAASTATPKTESDVVWRRVRRAVQDYAPAMMRFIRDVYGPGAVDEAWDEFMLWEDEVPALDPGTPHLQIFTPWFFHSWAPDPYDTAVADASLHDRSPTSIYLERRGRHLEPVLRRYLEACLESPFSFHEIRRCDPGRGFLARDVMTGEEREVLERGASQSLESGAILFGQLVPVEGIVMLEACAPFGFPPIRKLEIIELRKRILLQNDMFARELLRDWDSELRDLYLTLFDEVLNPPIPKLHNTDGDELAMHRLVFDVESAQAAFDALKHLAVGESQEELLSCAERDAEGDLLRVRFDWKRRGNRTQPGWDNTVLGSIAIDGTRLTAQVNSVKRAGAFRRAVEKALGHRAKHQDTEVESVEEMLSDTGTAEEISGMQEGPGRRGFADHDELAELPEVQEKVREMMARHYEHWATEKIPALGGRTPLEAVKDPDGREQVEALVAQIEFDAKTMKPPLDMEILRKMRGRLGLARDD